MKLNSIGMFDSGLGGIYVLKEILNTFSQIKVFYYGDNKNMPYGSKTLLELKSYAYDIIKYFEEKKVDAIICACGTLSSNLINEIQSMTNIKVYSIILPTIDYINSKDFKNILLLATPNTVNSKYFDNHINCNIEGIGLEKLAYLIENDLDYKDYLDSLLPNKNYDAIILGCTHYPKIKEYLENKYNTEIIDLGKNIVKVLDFNESKEEINLYFSKEDIETYNKAKKMLKE